MLAVPVFMAAAAMAADLIVRVDGTSVWARQVQAAGDYWRYVPDGGGPESQIARSDVDAVIPAVVRGTQYDAATVERVLSDIDRAIGRHGKLRKQLNMLRGEWGALQKDDSGLEKDIAAILAKFERDPADTARFKEARVALSMIQFKDMRGRYRDKIESGLAMMSAAYAATNMARLAVMTNIAGMTIGQFRVARQIAEDLRAAKIKPEDQAAVENSLAACRTNAWTFNGHRAWEAFQKEKNLQVYLDSASLLQALKTYVAADEQQQLFLDGLLAKLKAAVIKAVPDCSFDFEGFPLTRADRELLGRRRIQRIKLTSIALDDHCFAFPKNSPRAGGLRSVISCEVRLIFSRSPSSEHVYCLQAMYFADMGRMAVRRTPPLDPALVRNGRIDIAAEFDFTNLERDFEPQRQEDDGLYALVMPVFCDKLEQGKEDAEWKAAGLGFPVPVR